MDSIGDDMDDDGAIEDDIEEDGAIEDDGAIDDDIALVADVIAEVAEVLVAAGVLLPHADSSARPAAAAPTTRTRVLNMKCLSVVERARGSTTSFWWWYAG